MAERALLLDTIDPEAKRRLEGEGLEVVTFPSKLSEVELVAELNHTGAGILGVRTSPKLPAAIFDQAPDLYAVGCYSVGTNHIDLDAATRRGAAIFNAPFDNGRSVAEWAMITAGAVRRRLGVFNAQMHKGVFDKKVEGCRELRGGTIGIIGFGNIGTQLSGLAEAFGMNVMYHDTQPRPQYGRAKRARSLEELLKESDIVSVHVPGGQGRPVLGRKELKMLPEGALVINAARADAIDNEALKELILSGHLGGAAIDVHENEPSSKTQEFESVFKGMEEYNVLMTPHIAGSTEEALAMAARSVTELLLDYRATGSSMGAVNLPQLKVEPKPDAAVRVTYVHPNQPGQGDALTIPLGDAGLNRVNQDLRTAGDIGYMTADYEDGPHIEEKIQELLRELAEQPGVRIRIIGRTALETAR